MDIEFCSICTSSLDSDDDARRIRCSGQGCNLVFHQRCVHLTEAHVRSWLDEDVGLFWFCPACRVDFAPGGARSSRKHKIDGDDRLLEEQQEGETSSRELKKARMDSAPRLPPEIWTMIFEYLESRWLARLRLVCRGWNELVCSRAELMDRFVLKLGRVQFVDDLDDLRHFLALSGGFTRAEFDLQRPKDKPRIEWLSSLGQTLTTLTCWFIPFGFLCEMLRTLPNLKQLTLLHCFEYGKKMKLNYQLNNLEQLTIDGFNNKNYKESIFPTLQHICPKIIDLKFHGSFPCELAKQIGSFVYANRETLQKFTILSCFGLMDEIIKVSKDLRLKQLSINCGEQDLLRLIQRLPSLEHLHFYDRITNVSIFEEIPRVLQNLTTLKLGKVSLAATSPPNPLNLKRAEFIRVRYDASPDCVSGLSFCQSSSLQRLDISGAYLPSAALANLGQVANRIKDVRFSNCTVQRASAILTFMQQSKSLTVFELYSLTVKSVYDTPDLANGYSNIRHLKVKDKSGELLTALAELCPKLESLHIMNRVSAQEMSTMGQQLKRLKTLNLCWHEAVRGCLRQIPNGFDVLKSLQIACCRVSKEDIREALEGLRKDVEVAVEFWNPGWKIAPPPPREFQII